jgi:hypothetical protein
MSNLSEAELKDLQDAVSSLNETNKQIQNYSFAVYKASQLREQFEAKLQGMYMNASEKYNNGNPIDLNIETGEIKETEEK